MLQDYLDQMRLPLDYVIARNIYGLYCVPKRSMHRPASVEIINGRVWEPETISLICRFANAGDVVHAGTFFGDFLPAISKALALSQSCGPSSQIPTIFKLQLSLAA